jgi:DNA-directed RNA polymerase subunit RPC12/RpoP
MNKYQEALNRLKTNKNLTSREQRQYENWIQELVNRETPMKPKTIKNRKGTEWVCPNCNHHIAYFDELGIGTVRVFNYCIECGQRLNLRSDTK